MGGRNGGYQIVASEGAAYLIMSPGRIRRTDWYIGGIPEGGKTTVDRRHGGSGE